MKYHSEETVSVGDRIAYNRQSGCIALMGNVPQSGAPQILRKEWEMKTDQVLILFDNGARLMLDNTQQEELLVLVEKRTVQPP